MDIIYPNALPPDYSVAGSFPLDGGQLLPLQGVLSSHSSSCTNSWRSRPNCSSWWYLFGALFSQFGSIPQWPRAPHQMCMSGWALLEQPGATPGLVLLGYVTHSQGVTSKWNPEVTLCCWPPYFSSAVHSSSGGGWEAMTRDLSIY